MKRPAILVVCVLLLCGGLCQLYLAAQVKEAEKHVFQPVLPEPVAECCPIVEPPTVQPMVPLRPFTIAPMTGVASVRATPPPASPFTTLQPVHPVAVAPASPTPDISTFQLPIEYKLKNIPVELLMEFLAEKFTNAVGAEAAEDAGAITLTASLANHRVITAMLVELEREIAILRCAAANIAETAEPIPVLPAEFIVLGPPLQ